MSNKPIKKSDMGKAWIKPRRDSQKMISPEYHLIVTEGTQTEPLYFNSIKDIINEKYKDRIHLDITGKGDNTISLFKRAVIDVNKSYNVYKHVWLVYDKDDFPNDHFDHTDELCRKASTEETHFHPIWSNQCIELWFLLHFMFMQSDLHRSEYYPKISKYLQSIDSGKYCKNRPDMFDVLKPYLEDAIKNARQLDEINTGLLPSESSPGTKVYILIEMLKPYLI